MIRIFLKRIKRVLYRACAPRSWYQEWEKIQHTSAAFAEVQMWRKRFCAEKSNRGDLNSIRFLGDRPRFYDIFRTYSSLDMLEQWPEALLEKAKLHDDLEKPKNA